MKKTLLFFVAMLSIGIIGAYAQGCTPNQNLTEPGIYPDSAQGLPHACHNASYATDIQIVMPTDTTTDVPGFGTLTLNINYFQIDSVSGLPPGFDYVCNPSNCRFPGGSNGCINLFGPELGTSGVGDYPLVVYVTPNLNHSLLGDFDGPQSTIDDYSIVVDICDGVEVFDLANFQLGQNIPNPFSRTTTVRYSHPSVEEMTFVVYDMLGKVVHQKKFMSEIGMNEFNFDATGLNQGVYMYTLSDGKQSYTKRMVISAK